MSWWVDSAMAAYELIQQWFEVIAWFMKNYADESNPYCQTREDRDMALKVSQFLWIKTFIIFDFRKEYDNKIIQYIYNSYKLWLTPNPDILCNTEVKFKLFLEKWLELGCEYIATGHYAQNIYDSNTWLYYLKKWADNNKDQTYFLSWLNQYQLSHSLFPVWHMAKPNLRKKAAEIWLPNADRKDSQWLCFVWKVDMKTFLAKALPRVEWDIVDTQGALLGIHEWAHFYTIGQRQWLWLSGGPRYVVHRNIKKNIITVGRELEPDMYSKEVYIKNIHRTLWEKSELPLRAVAKIRYRQEDQKCVLTLDDHQENKYKVTFFSEQRASAAWQTIVFYRDSCVIASGVIVK